ncbi:MAG: hypothetical protein ACMXYG_02110 [Candidatus Woesearchaeota archaeon]
MTKFILLLLFFLSVFSVIGFSLEKYPSNEITVYTITHSVNQQDFVESINIQPSITTNMDRKYDISQQLGKYLDKNPFQYEGCRTVVLRKGITTKDITNAQAYYRDCSPPQPYHTIHSQQYITYENLGLPWFNARRSR